MRNLSTTADAPSLKSTINKLLIFLIPRLAMCLENDFGTCSFCASRCSGFSFCNPVLYNYGARKVVLIGVGRIGCSPNELARNSPNGVNCIEEIDSAVGMFNTRLIRLVDEFNTLDGAHFTYINGYGIFDDILRNFAAYGLRMTNTGCCGVGRNNGQITCLPMQVPCTNRNEYLFWDAFHPSEAANIVIGKRSYNAQSPNDVYPMDIHTLARI